MTQIQAYVNGCLERGGRVNDSNTGVRRWLSGEGEDE